MLTSYSGLSSTLCNSQSLLFFFSGCIILQRTSQLSALFSESSLLSKVFDFLIFSFTGQKTVFLPYMSIIRGIEEGISSKWFLSRGSSEILDLRFCSSCCSSRFGERKWLSVTRENCPEAGRSTKKKLQALMISEILLNENK